MGRDGAIPRKFFGYLDPVRNTPKYNILLNLHLRRHPCSMLMSYQTGAELLNFGAFVAFMGVNLAAIARYYIRGSSHGLRSILLNLLPPLLRLPRLCLHLVELADSCQKSRASSGCCSV